MSAFTGYNVKNCCETITGIEYLEGSSDNYAVSVDLASPVSKDFNALTVNTIEGYGNWSSCPPDARSAMDMWRYVTNSGRYLTWEPMAVDFQIIERNGGLVLRTNRRRTILEFNL